MRTLALAVLLGLACSVLTGCGLATAPVIPPAGLLYTSTTAPLDVDMARTELGTKVGKASCHAILGLIATGDASTAAAARAGGLRVINHADYQSHLIFFGVYSSYTTIVYGD